MAIRIEDQRQMRLRKWCRCGDRGRRRCGDKRWCGDRRRCGDRGRRGDRCGRGDRGRQRCRCGRNGWDRGRCGCSSWNRCRRGRSGWYWCGCESRCSGWDRSRCGRGIGSVGGIGECTWGGASGSAERSALPGLGLQLAQVRLPSWPECPRLGGELLQGTDPLRKRTQPG